MQGPEYGAFLDYRRVIAGLIPLEAQTAYVRTSLADELVVDVEVDEALLAERLRGNQPLLRELKIMMVQWADLTVLYQQQREFALRLLNLLQVNDNR
jgi:hypothetical protein